MFTDAHCLSILVPAKELKTKAGKYKMRDEDRAIIDQFLVFDLENSWMESKDHTKLGKLLAKCVATGAAIIGEPFEQRNSIACPRSSDMTIPIRHTYSHIIGAIPGDGISTFTLPHLKFILNEEDVATQEDKEFIRLMISRVIAVQPIVERFKAMSKRLTRNGKLPKEEEERRHKAFIKGKLDKKIADVLTAIKDEWIVIIFKNEMEWRLNMVKSYKDLIPEVNALLASYTGINTPLTKDQEETIEMLYQCRVINSDRVKSNGRSYSVYSFKSQEDFEKEVKRIAEDEGESFYFKMADKLGGLATGKFPLIDATHTPGSKKTPWLSTIEFRFEDNSMIEIENKIIVNRSVLNTEFYQYPCTFTRATLHGEPLKNLSEFTVKKAFLNDVNEPVNGSFEG